jgi:hypothetical protein
MTNFTVYDPHRDWSKKRIEEILEEVKDTEKDGDQWGDARICTINCPERSKWKIRNCIFRDAGEENVRRYKACNESMHKTSTIMNHLFKVSDLNKWESDW